jgi:predicted outer membrane protein
MTALQLLEKKTALAVAVSTVAAAHRAHPPTQSPLTGQSVRAGKGQLFFAGFCVGASFCLLKVEAWQAALERGKAVQTTMRVS